MPVASICLLKLRIFFQVAELENPMCGHVRVEPLAVHEWSCWAVCQLLWGMNGFQCCPFLNVRLAIVMAGKNIRDLHRLPDVAYGTLRKHVKNQHQHLMPMFLVRVAGEGVLWCGARGCGRQPVSGRGTCGAQC